MRLEGAACPSILKKTLISQLSLLDIPRCRTVYERVLQNVGAWVGAYLCLMNLRIKSQLLSTDCVLRIVQSFPYKAKEVIASSLHFCWWWTYRSQQPGYLSLITFLKTIGPPRVLRYQGTLTNINIFEIILSDTTKLTFCELLSLSVGLGYWKIRWGTFLGRDI